MKIIRLKVWSILAKMTKMFGGEVCEMLETL